MFHNTLRILPATLRVIGGTARSLSCGPGHPSMHVPSCALIPRYNPIIIDPLLIINQKNILDIPVINKSIIDVPRKIIPLSEKIKSITLEDPDKVIEKQAARLIVIRRRKMKRHKLKKLRIKMKFLWAKVRQKREMRKEKAFQAELMCKIKDAKSFDARQYVREQLDKANAVLTPKKWKYLPDFVIQDIISKRNKKESDKLKNLERRKKMNLKASDYKF